MKGLLLKDFYMVKKYCKSYLLIVALFVAASLASDDNLFFLFYPCMLCGMIPGNLLGYDERSRWLQYSGTLPYTKSQIVSGKYLIGLMVQSIILILSGITQAVRMNVSGTFELGEYLVLMAMVLLVSCVASSFCLPFMFKLGVEKGRIAYLVVVGVVCGASVMASSLFSTPLQREIPFNGMLLLLCLIGIVGYILSWYLSIVFYNKREIN